MADKIIVELASPERKYVKVYHDFLRCSLLTAEEKIIFVVLKSFIDFSVDKNGAQGEVFPTVDTICKLSSLSKPRVIRTIKSLVQKGIVKKIQRGLTKSNLYVLSDYSSMWSCDTVEELKEVVNNEGVRPLTIEEHIEALKKLGCHVQIKAKELSSAPATVTEESPHSSETDNNTEKSKSQEKLHSCNLSVEDIIEKYELEDLKVDFKDNAMHLETLERVIKILFEMLNTTKATIRVEKEDMPAEVVRERLEELEPQHIKHLVETYCSIKDPVQHGKGYIKTMLFNGKESYDDWFHEICKKTGV